jgi:hypothetical protein
MSHWRKFESNVLTDTKEDLLGKALAEMGVELDTSIKSIRNTWGNDSVDMGFRKDGRAISLGLRYVNTEAGKKVELTGDFYGTGLNEQGFIDKLAQVYQKHNIIEKLEEQGWQIDEIGTDENGQVFIDAYQWS